MAECFDAKHAGSRLRESSEWRSVGFAPRWERDGLARLGQGTAVVT